MSIALVVTRGFGNGTFSGTIAGVALRGFVSAIAVGAAFAAAPDLSVNTNATLTTEITLQSSSVASINTAGALSSSAQLFQTIATVNIDTDAILTTEITLQSSTDVAVTTQAALWTFVAQQGPFYATIEDQAHTVSIEDQAHTVAIEDQTNTVSIT